MILEFYSHRDKKIIEHFNEVRVFCRVEEKNLDRACEILAYTHDFGKYTTYFQDHLFGREKVKSELSNHGFISAVLGAYVGFNIFNEEEDMLPLILFSCILHHHGNLENVEQDLPRKINGIDKIRDDRRLISNIENAHKQIKNIKLNKDIIIKDYENTIVYPFIEEFIKKEPIEEILKKLKKLQYTKLNQVEKSNIYFTHQYLYSTLISGDKYSASALIPPYASYQSFHTFMEVKNKKFSSNAKQPSSDINDIRQEIFNKVQENAEISFSKSKIFSVTSPTGTGKTITGFFAALKIKEKLGGQRKIIYALPFTSIINQNYDVIKEMLSQGLNKEADSSYIIKHHSLSDIDFKDSKGSYTKSQSEMLLENWNSGIVVTTFVQLMQTLIGNKNRMLKKFYSFKNSIIILDEIQAVDIKYYKLLDYALKELTEKMGCILILMTATKPIILETAQELLPDNEYYFSKFNRTELIPHLDKKIRIEEFIDIFYDAIEEDKSYLIICNTINQSLKIWKELKRLDRNVYYLSTNLLPCHRKNILEKVKLDIKSEEKPILVSTQVIEAGVDIDFDEVIRDIAPLDSIIQSAGRCNRNGGKARGKVHIYKMADESDKIYGRYVYGHTLLGITENLLKDKLSIQEKEYLYLINNYFEDVSQNMSNHVSQKFIYSMNNLLFNKSPEEGFSLNKFSLIEENSGYIEVFFRIDEKAEKIYETMLKAFSEKDLNRRNDIYLTIKNHIREYTLSVPYKFKDRFDLDSIIINLPKEGCEMFYNSETGFSREEEDFFVF